MNLAPPKVLLLGYGNPGRLDDGLGPALAARIEALHLPGLTTDSDYQLTVEDAARVAEFDAVIFADAAVAGPEPFSLREIEPTGELSFSSHSVEPAAVLALAHELFATAAKESLPRTSRTGSCTSTDKAAAARRPRGFVLGLRGYEFNEFGERLSEAAHANLAAAVEFVQTLARRDFAELLESEPEAQARN